MSIVHISSRLRAVLCVCRVGLAAAVRPGHAQETLTTASVAGVVADPQGTSVGGAEVTVR